MTVLAQSSIKALRLSSRTLNGLQNYRNGETGADIQTISDLLREIRATTPSQFRNNIWNFGTKSHRELLAELRRHSFLPEHKWTPEQARARMFWRDCGPSFTIERFEVKAQVTEDQDGNTLYRLMARRADRIETFREYRPVVQVVK